MSTFIYYRKIKWKDAKSMIICCVAWLLAEIVTRIYLAYSLFCKKERRGKKTEKTHPQSGCLVRSCLKLSEN